MTAASSPPNSATKKNDLAETVNLAG